MRFKKNQNCGDLGQNIKVGYLVTCVPYGISWDERVIFGGSAETQTPLGRVDNFPVFRVIKQITNDRFLLKEVCKLTWGDGYYNKNGKKKWRVNYKSYFMESDINNLIETEMPRDKIILISKQKADILKHNKIKLYERNY